MRTHQETTQSHFTHSGTKSEQEANTLNCTKTSVRVEYPPISPCGCIPLESAVLKDKLKEFPTTLTKEITPTLPSLSLSPEAMIPAVPKPTTTESFLETSSDNKVMREEKLKPTMDQLEQALQSANVGVWVWDLIQNRRMRTHMADRLLGLEQATHFTPLTFSTIVEQAIHPDDREKVKKSVPEVLQSKNNEYEVSYRVIWPDQSIHHLITRGKVVRDHTGKPLQIVGATLEVTELKQLEQEHLATTQRLQAQEKKRADESEDYWRKQTDFINTLCHEIRNPLNGVFGYIDALEKHSARLKTLVTPSLDPSLIQTLNDFENDIAILKTCAEQQKTIMDDVLDLSKIHAQKMELNETLFNPQQTIRHVMNMLSPRHATKALAITLDLTQADTYIKADESRFRQIIINLVSNAIKFTDQGEITVTAQCVPSSPPLQTTRQNQKEEKTTAPTEKLNPQSHYLHCQIKDTGIGMTPEEQKQIFTPFGQANKHISATHGGSGLGLVISQHLVTLMGGTLQVVSQKGQGSLFNFTIRYTALAPEEQPQTRSDHPCPRLDQPALSAPKHILITEDNEINQKIITRFLKEAGCSYQLAHNGQEAVELYQKYRFDAILMDVLMPGMDGLEATRQIRALEQKKGISPIPIIGTSGNTSRDQIAAATQAGMTHYLTKPYLKTDIYRLINTQTAVPKHEDTLHVSHPQENKEEKQGSLSSTKKRKETSSPSEATSLTPLVKPPMKNTPSADLSISPPTEEEAGDPKHSAKKHKEIHAKTPCTTFTLEKPEPPVTLFFKAPSSEASSQSHSSDTDHTLQEQNAHAIFLKLSPQDRAQLSTLSPDILSAILRKSMDALAKSNTLPLNASLCTGIFCDPVLKR